MLLLHRDAVPSGQLLDVLADCGLEPVVVRAGESGGQLPDPRSVKVAILLGSDLFRDVAEQEWFERELDWLRRADGSGTTVLGVGHGARAIAIAFGGGVQTADRPNRGWTMVSTSVPHRIAGGPWLSWQHELISLPPRAELLAHNRFGPQAFRVGRHLAIQFHPEATTQTVTRWVASSDDALDATEILAATSRDATAADVCAPRLFSTFIDTM
ncbi:MAG: type 1 glutamine amidotransferase [Solirubrobacteraceae bacterium]